MAALGSLAAVPVIIGTKSARGQTYEQNANGQVLYYTYNQQGQATPTYSPDDNNWSQALVMGTAGSVGSYGSPIQNVITQPSNWSTAYFPGQTMPTYNYSLNSVTYVGAVDPTPTSDNVTIPGGSTVNDNIGSLTVASLALGTGAVLNINGAESFAITGNMSNNGLVTVNSTDYHSSSLSFSGGTVSGSGAIDLLYNTGFLTGTLTQSPGHTVEGAGYIQASLTNNGTVNANVNSSGAALVINTTSVTNNSVLEATNNGNLTISGITVNQGTGGQILANGGTVNLASANITGGTLSSSVGSFQDISTATLTNVTLATGTEFDIQGGNVLNITGNLTDNGLIQVNSTNYHGSTLNFSGGTLSGTGTIRLLYSGGYVTGTFTQSAGQTIDGTGYIQAALTNNGTVNADANISGQSLTINTTNVINNATFEATNNGSLTISGITVTQGASGQILANGATAYLASANISGGTLSSSAGSFQDLSTATLNNVTLATGTEFDIQGANGLNITSNLVNNGLIQLNTTNYHSSTINFTGGTLSGTGTIRLLYTSGYVTGTLTQSAANTIDGSGFIQAALTNNGTVNADVNNSNQSLTINTNSVTNNATFEATNNGSLGISGITVTQGAAGQILANGGTVYLYNNANISGGTLSSSAGSFQDPNSASLNNVTIATGTEFDIQGSCNLNITGNLSNSGLIQVNTSDYHNSYVIFAGGTLSGTGTIRLLYNGGFVTGTLTQAAGHTIDGSGGISATLINNGTVSADLSGQTLNITGPVTNNGLFLATNGGTLSVNNGLTNGTGTTLTGGTYEADANSTLILSGNIATNAANVIVGGAGANFAALAPLANNSGTVSIYAGGAFSTASALTNTGTITTAAASGNLSSGHVTITGAFNQSSGQTNDGGSITVTGATNITGGVLTIFNTGTFTGSPITVGPAGQLIADGSLAGSPALTDQGSVIFGANPNLGFLTRTLSALNLNTSGSAVVMAASVSANRTLLITSALTFTGTTNAWTGQLDLADNDIDVKGGSLTNITSQIKQAYARGTWQGSGGITSSTAAGDTTHLTALGTIQNSINGNASGPVLYSSFDGYTSLLDTDVLAKYTYYGDANLDGKVDGSDYSLIDNGFSRHLTGWYNGDFNYDGVIDGSDYALIDNSFNTQRAHIVAEIGSPVVTIAAQISASSNAVPEPASALLAIPTIALISRRRRHRRAGPSPARSVN